MNLKEIYKKNYIPEGIEINTALEIGPGKGDFSNFLQENGVLVTAIDPNESNNLNKNVHFIKDNFETYTLDKNFDLVHARNVLPFFKNKPEQLKRMLSIGSYVFFTFFGPKDPWAERGMSATKDEMLNVLEGCEIMYSSEEEYIGPMMSGELKPWHIFTYLVKTNS